MDDGIKQRLIGAIVLLALMVIFLPVLFDRESLEPIDTESQIPPAPEIETLVIPPAEEPFVESPAPMPEDMLIPDEESPADLGAEKPGLDSQGIPNTWVLQVATFSQHNLATKMRDELIEKGYPAYIRQVDRKSKKPLTKVYVGPKLNKGLMVETKKKIDKDYKIDSLLLELNPKKATK